MGRFSKDTTVEQYTQESTLMGEFVAGLGNQKKSYGDGLDLMDTSVTNAGKKMTSWGPDDVQTKMETFLTDLQKTSTSITGDISGGGFSSLEKTATQLVEDIGNCKVAKDAWEDSKNDYKSAQSAYTSAVQAYTHAPEEDRDDARRWKDTKKQELDAAKLRMDKLEETLDQFVNATNSNFDLLKEYTFNPSEGQAGFGGQGGAGTNNLGPIPGSQEWEEMYGEWEAQQLALLGYFNGEQEPVESKETVDDPVIAPDTDGDKTTDYTQHSHEENTFADGAHTDMDYQTEGKADVTNPDNPELHPEHKTGEGTLTDAEGKDHKVNTDETWGDNGKHVLDVTISTPQGEMETHENDDTTTQATNSSEMDVKANTDKKDVKEQDGSVTTTTTTTISATAGENEVATTTKTTSNTKDPEVGVSEYQDGSYNYKSERYRDDKGNLHERIYEDGNLISDDPVEHDYRTVTVKNPKTNEVVSQRTYDFGTEAGLQQYYAETSAQAASVPDHYGFASDPNVLRTDIGAATNSSGIIDGSGTTMDFYNAQVEVTPADGLGDNNEN